MNKLLTLVVFLLVTLFSTISKTNTVPDEIEFQVLHDIFHSLGGQNWTTKTNWPTYGNWPSSATHQEFSQWHGIVVTNAYITSILLKTNNLSGTLPSSIE